MIANILSSLINKLKNNQPITQDDANKFLQIQKTIHQQVLNAIKNNDTKALQQTLQQTSNVINNPQVHDTLQKSTLQYSQQFKAQYPSLYNKAKLKFPTIWKILAVIGIAYTTIFTITSFPVILILMIGIALFAKVSITDQIINYVKWIKYIIKSKVQNEQEPHAKIAIEAGIVLILNLIMSRLVYNVLRVPVNPKTKMFFISFVICISLVLLIMLLKNIYHIFVGKNQSNNQ